MKFLEESAFILRRREHPAETNKLWKEDEVKQLLELVEKYPIIYNGSGNRQDKREAWSKISSQMNIECKFLKLFL